MPCALAHSINVCGRAASGSVTVSCALPSRDGPRSVELASNNASGPPITARLSDHRRGPYARDGHEHARHEDRQQPPARPHLLHRRCGATEATPNSRDRAIYGIPLIPGCCPGGTVGAGGAKTGGVNRLPPVGLMLFSVGAGAAQSWRALRSWWWSSLSWFRVPSALPWRRRPLSRPSQRSRTGPKSPRLDDRGDVNPWCSPIYVMSWPGAVGTLAKARGRRPRGSSCCGEPQEVRSVPAAP